MVSIQQTGVILHEEPDMCGRSASIALAGLTGVFWGLQSPSDCFFLKKDINVSKTNQLPPSEWNTRCDHKVCDFGWTSCDILEIVALQSQSDHWYSTSLQNKVTLGKRDEVVVFLQWYLMKHSNIISRTLKDYFNHMNAVPPPFKSAIQPTCAHPDGQKRLFEGCGNAFKWQHQLVLCFLNFTWWLFDGDCWL